MQRQLTTKDLVTLILAVVQAITATALLHTQSCGAQEVALWTGWCTQKQGKNYRKRATGI